MSKYFTNKYFIFLVTSSRDTTMEKFPIQNYFVLTLCGSFLLYYGILIPATTIPLIAGYYDISTYTKQTCCRGSDLNITSTAWLSKTAYLHTKVLVGNTTCDTSNAFSLLKYPALETMYTTATQNEVDGWADKYTIISVFTCYANSDYTHTITHYPDDVGKYAYGIIWGIFCWIDFIGLIYYVMCKHECKSQQRHYHRNIYDEYEESVITKL